MARDGARADAASQGVAALAEVIDLLGRRHALPVFWILRDGPTAFRSLAARLDATESHLSQRLRELREAGIIEVDEAGDYRLSAHGRRLQGLLEPLDGWARQWSRLGPRGRVPRGSATRGRGES
ncbi:MULTISPECIES: winged helix-turn-helix transcriptional regulator [Protofrankia]|uniref:Helix-turn-helix HxlR type n=1 Tax=Candidatus Protofrankia datiscae TaxID=2716812 RepID=F8AZZ3_9ACTN|nr:MULTISPECIES: winged helix-turn-helix transcriptional regulator [Protofrankia]AEH10640.1 helix-turn-helix HxlR type [Candidatus Protofrankia datiscae]